MGPLNKHGHWHVNWLFTNEHEAPFVQLGISHEGASFLKKIIKSIYFGVKVLKYNVTKKLQDCAWQSLMSNPCKIKLKSWITKILKWAILWTRVHIKICLNLPRKFQRKYINIKEFKNNIP